MLSNGSCSAASIMSIIALSPIRAPQRMPWAIYGARLMLSAPPPTAMSASPSRMLCAAETIACRPDPHSRLTVSAGASWVTPAPSAATRAMYMSFGSVWMTLPNTTCPTSAPATPARTSASRTTCEPSALGAMSLSAPPKSPIAVRTPETTITSRCIAGCCMPGSPLGSSLGVPAGCASTAPGCRILKPGHVKVPQQYGLRVPDTHNILRPSRRDRPQPACYSADTPDPGGLPMDVTTTSADEHSVRFDLLTENPVYKPFRYPWAYEAWLTQQRVHWLPEEVPLADDVKDWHRNLTDAE